MACCVALAFEAALLCLSMSECEGYKLSTETIPPKPTPLPRSQTWRTQRRNLKPWALVLLLQMTSIARRESGTIASAKLACVGRPEAELVVAAFPLNTESRHQHGRISLEVLSYQDSPNARSVGRQRCVRAADGDCGCSVRA